MEAACTVCLDQFSEEVRGKVPKVLPCGHSFCQDCVDSLAARALASGKKSFACPHRCGKSCKFGEKTGLDLPKNFALLTAMRPWGKQSTAPSTPVMRTRSREPTPTVVLWPRSNSKETGKRVSELFGLAAGNPVGEKNSLEERKRSERDYAKQHDASNQIDCGTWYLITTAWLARWRAFVEQNGQEPGEIDNTLLVQGNAAQTLRPMEDYIGVTETVWKMYRAQYGGGPQVVRASVDLDSRKIGDSPW
mmetsp:Transcript_15418/g.35198  ORF Transcript_15418/g.35198 Transcript_15418/m.35198 type:complete len:248 (-) Transcript_15418:120-863(-)